MADGGYVRYGVLGSLEVTGDDGRVLPLQGDKQCTLLAVLLCERSRAVSADRLSSALWPHGQTPAAKRSIPVYIHRLRAVLGRHRLQNDAGNGYRLIVQPDELDADSFERLAAKGQAELEAGDPEAASESLTRALAMWRSYAYAGMEDVELLRAEADRLNELRAVSIEARMDAELTLGRHRKVVPELTALLHEHPLRDRLRAQLMLALYRSGRAAEALRLYRETRTLFIEELGTEPATELRELERSILQEDRHLDCPDRWLDSESSPANRARVVPETLATPAELPWTVPTFTGRQGELAHLLGIRSRLVALNGPGGVGKSTLALQAAASLAARHPDGQLYVNLRGASPGVAPLTPMAALQRFLRALGLPDRKIPSEPDEAAVHFRSLTARRRLLVVLDDAVDETQVLPLLPSGPDSTTLITSRAVLGGLDGAEHLPVEGMDDAEAVALLARLIGQEWVAAEPDSATEVVRRCGRLPLAVRIAGARLVSRPDWRLSDLAARLRDERSRLDELQHGDLAVRTSLAIGRQGIGDHAERLLGLLGLLDLDDVSLPAAAALDGRSMTRVRRDLDRLAAAQLLEPCPEDDRYSLHDLVRLHAREQAAVQISETEQTKAIRRLVHFYLATMRNASRRYAPRSPWRVRTGLADDELRAKGLEFDDREAIIGWIRVESGNLVRVAHHAARLPGEEESLITYSVAMHVPVQSQGYWNERKEVYELALASTNASRSTGLSLVQHDLGLVYRYLGLLDPAEVVLEQAAQAFREHSDAYLEADTLVRLAEVDRERPDHRAALEHLDSARAISHDLADHRIEAIILATMGELMAKAGNYADARAYFDQALDLHRRNSSTTGAGRALGHLGELCKRFSHPEEAVPFFEQAIAAHHKVGFSLREAERTWDLADVLYDLGQPDAARAHWCAALDLATRLAVISPERAAALRAEAKPVKPPALRSDA